jgi:putative peptidoglycan lipid II flippase
VPDDLDEIACRALGIPVRHGGEPLRSPAALTSALAAAHVTSRIPAVPGSKPQPSRAPSYPAQAYDSSPAPERSRATTFAWAVAGLVLVVGLVLFGGQLALTGLGGESQGDERGGSGTSDSQEPPRSASRLKVADATSFDPPPAGNGEENSDRAALAVDGEPGTAWTTKTYLDPFGPAGLKDGVGLLLDLGEPSEVATVAVELEGGATDLEVRVADQVGAAADDFELVDEVSGADGRAVLRPDEPVTARYVLLWLTSLPAIGDSSYRGEVSEVVLRG